MYDDDCSQIQHWCSNKSQNFDLRSSSGPYISISFLLSVFFLHFIERLLHLPYASDFHSENAVVLRNHRI